MILALTSEVHPLVPALTGAFISAFVSFSVFVLTQLFLFQKSRSDLLRSKLEDLWKSLIEVMKQTRPLTVDASDLNQEAIKNLNERATLLIESLLAPTAFIALYFPQLNCRYSEVNRACGELAALMRKAPPAPPQLGGAKHQTGPAVYENAMKTAGWKKELGDASAKAKASIGGLLTYLRENQGSLIKTPKDVLLEKFDELSGQ